MFPTYTKQAMKINGEYIEDLIDGYHTLNVSGRETLPVEQNTIDMNDMDGSKFNYKRYKPRTLTIAFVIEGENNTELRTKLDHLNNILDADEATMVFRDEDDKFYVGTRNGEPNFDIQLGVAVGSFEMVCNDPFKYSTHMFYKDPNADDDHTIVFNYNGTYKAYPILEARFHDAVTGGSYSDDGDCGYVAFIDSYGNIIQLGNPDEADVNTSLDPNESLINCNFSSVSAWTENAGVIFPNTYAKAGNLSIGSLTDSIWAKTWTNNTVHPTVLGSGANNWHGPSLSMRPSKGDQGAGAENFEFSWVQHMSSNAAAERGMFQALLVNDDNSVVAGVRIYKSGDSTTGVCDYIVDDVIQDSVNIDLSYYNTHFGYRQQIPYYVTKSQVRYYNKKGTKYKLKKQSGYTKKKKVTWQEIGGYNYTTPNLNSSITKLNGKISFNIGNLGVKEYATASTKKAHTVVFYFGTYDSATSMENYLMSAKFVRVNADTFYDIENTFASGDVVTTVVEEAEIYLRHALPDTIDSSLPPGTVHPLDPADIGERKPMLGALGNDWEEFMLMPGVNQINCQYSDWVLDAYAPKFRVYWREVYL